MVQLAGIFRFYKTQDPADSTDVIPYHRVDSSPYHVDLKFEQLRSVGLPVYVDTTHSCEPKLKPHPHQFRLIVIFDNG